MGMFVLGLAVGCAVCALVATVLFSVLGLTIVGKRKCNNQKKEKDTGEQND